MHALRKWLSRLDSWVYQLERALLLISLVAMTTLVFSDMIQRTFTREVGKTASMLIAVFSVDSAETQALFANVIGPVVVNLIFLVLAIAGTQTARSIRAERNDDDKPTLGKSVVIGVVIHAMFAAYVIGVVKIFPTGIAGSSKMALGFMVWAGLLGASLATRTRRHLALESIKARFDESTKIAFGFISALLATAFCAFMVWLSHYKAWEQIHEWVENPAIGVFDAVPIPEWTVTIAIPWCFFMIGVRSLGAGVSDLLYGPPLETEDPFGITDDDDKPNEEPLPDVVYGAPHGGAP